MKHFVKNWQRLTNDPMILDIVNNYEIPFILPPRQSRLPNLCQLTKEPSDLVDQEIQDMLRKGAIEVSDPKKDQFLSSLFLVKKKDGSESPSSQPKGPEQKYSVSTLQDGRVVPIKGNIVTRGQNVQNRPEGCTLCNPPVSESMSDSSGKGFYTSFVVFASIYLDDMLLLASSLGDLLMARDALIFILQHSGFLINIKKSYLELTSTLEFLRVIVDSGKITLNHPKEKLLKVQNHCQEILEKGKVTVRGLSKLIGRLLSTAIAVLPAPLH